MSGTVKPREVRRLAFQWLYQIDAIGEASREEVFDLVDERAREGLTDREIERSWSMASGAYAAREAADTAVAELAPTWPPSRQPAVDRAIFRLAYYEMHHLETNPKTVVNEAVELAKKFSTERSPAFVNGVLDKLLKRVLPGRETHAPTAQASPPPAAPSPTGTAPAEPEG